MPVPRRRKSRARRDRARTHKKLHPREVVKCSCGADRMPHRICPECGVYNGRNYKTIVTS